MLSGLLAHRSVAISAAKVRCQPFLHVIEASAVPCDPGPLRIWRQLDAAWGLYDRFGEQAKTDRKSAQGRSRSPLPCDPQSRAQVFRHRERQAPCHRDRTLALPALELGSTAVEERCGLAVPQLAVPDEEVNARLVVCPREHAADLAVAAGLGLALPLHPVEAEEVVFVMAARGQPALLQGGQ